MSLTSQDLQAIGDLIEEKLDQKLTQKLEPIKKDLRKIKKTLDESISFFDHELIDHVCRLDRVENRVGLTKFSNPA